MILNVEGEHGDGIRYEGSGRHDFCSCSCVHSLLANEVGILSSVQYRSHAAYLVKHFQTNVLVCSTVQLPAASPGHRYHSSSDGPAGSSSEIIPICIGWMRALEKMQQAIACPMTMQERPLVANRAPVPSHTRNERRHNASGEVSLRSSRFSQAHA